MKTGLLFHSFMNVLILFPLVSANSTSQPVITDAQLKNVSTIRILVATEIPLKITSEITNRLIENIRVKNNGTNSTAVLTDNILAGNDKKAIKLKNQFHIIKIKPEYLRKHYSNQVSERSNHLNTPTYRHNFNNFLKLFNYKLQKRGLYFDPYYPDFDPHSHLNELERIAYHPYFHSSYSIHNLPRKFMNRGKSLDNSIFGYPGYYSEKAFTPYYQVINASATTNQPNLLSSDDLPSRRKFTTKSGISGNETVTTSTVQNDARGKSKIALNFLNMMFPKFENVAEMNENSLNKTTFEKTNLSSATEDFHYGESEFTNSQYETLAVSNFHENKSNEVFPLSNKQVRFERTYLRDDSRTDNLNISNNRVYYEKMPQNLNLSWFVYANCSRDNCLLTNSTNETELLNEGWVMHNCTNYGCTEMYPRTESLRKFIGLMLLVFSLCIMKIIVFALLFHYCRHIRMSKNQSQDGDPESWDEEKFDSYLEKKKRARDVAMETFSENGAKEFNESKPKSTEQNVDDDNSNISPGENIHLTSPLLQELPRDNSKVWIPPFQRVSSCLVPSKSSAKICIPKKVLIKKSSKVKTSNSLLKFKRKNQTCIPRLEKRLKNGVRNGNKSEEKKVDNGFIPKIPKPIKPAVEEETELLLMNLDDEINTNDLPYPHNIEKTSDWEALLKNDNQSFISLDLND